MENSSLVPNKTSFDDLKKSKLVLKLEGKISIFLLFIQIPSVYSFALTESKDSEQINMEPPSSYVFDEDSHPSRNHDMNFSDSDEKVTKEGSSMTWEVKRGKVDLSVTKIAVKPLHSHVWGYKAKKHFFL